MKVGDLVMFNNTESRYAKWFYGHMGVVESYTKKGSDGKAHCRVSWLQPVKYYDRYATISDFGANNFEVYNESR